MSRATGNRVSHPGNDHRKDHLAEPNHEEQTAKNNNNSCDQLPNVGTLERSERVVEAISTIWAGKRLRGNELVALGTGFGAHTHGLLLILTVFHVCY